MRNLWIKLLGFFGYRHCVDCDRLFRFYISGDDLCPQCLKVRTRAQMITQDVVEFLKDDKGGTNV
jgi:hypothetical protein